MIPQRREVIRRLLMILTLKPVSYIFETRSSRIDPSLILNKDCLDVFYETIQDFETQNKSKIDSREWNDLIFKIKQLDEQFHYAN